MLQTISNADGTLSLIQIDPNNLITLPDGTSTIQVQGVVSLDFFKLFYLISKYFIQQLHTQSDGSTVHTVQQMTDGHTENMQIDLNEATINQDGQIIITGEDGHSKRFHSFLSNTKTFTII